MKGLGSREDESDDLTIEVKGPELRRDRKVRSRVGSKRWSNLRSEAVRLDQTKQSLSF